MKNNKLLEMIVASSLLVNSLNPSLVEARKISVNGLSYESFVDSIGERRLYVFNKKDSQIRYTPSTKEVEFSAPGITRTIIDSNFLKTLYDHRDNFSWDEFEEGSLEVYTEHLDIALNNGSVNIGYITKNSVVKQENYNFSTKPVNREDKKKLVPQNKVKTPRLESLITHKVKISPRPVIVNKLEYNFDEDFVNVPRLSDTRFLDSVYVAIETENTRDYFRRLTLNQDYKAANIKSRQLTIEAKNLSNPKLVSVPRLRQNQETLIELGLKKPDTTKRRVIYGLAAFSLGIVINALTNNEKDSKKPVTISEPIDPIK